MSFFTYRKNIKLQQWLLKWHFLSGIIILPFVLLLAGTGLIYLFKDTYENPQQLKLRRVKVENNKLSYDTLWDIANKKATNKPHTIIINNNNDEAVEFVSGEFGNTSHIFINPYNGSINGEIIVNETPMYKIRKLHGELLLGSWGTKLVELVGSWLMVMLITGMYLWWPMKKWRIKGFFIPRFKQGREVLFRDLHAISGFWISIVLLMILAGGLPWTDVFGGNFKKLQQITNTGYPATWGGHGVYSTITNDPMYINNIVQIVKEKYPLPGIVSLKIPTDSTSVYSLSNTYTKNLGAQKMIHLDQYSGKVLLKHSWSDVGVLMRARMWFMAFHQGQLGKLNFLLIVFTACILIIMCLSAMGMYFTRKNNVNTKVNIPYKPKALIVSVTTILGILLPLFGLSILLILVVKKLKSIKL